MEEQPATASSRGMRFIEAAGRRPVAQDRGDQVRLGIDVDGLTEYHNRLENTSNWAWPCAPWPAPPLAAIAHEVPGTKISIRRLGILRMGSLFDPARGENRFTSGAGTFHHKESEAYVISERSARQSTAKLRSALRLPYPDRVTFHSKRPRSFRRDRSLDFCLLR
jgi:hypothetical protein